MLKTIKMEAVSAKTTQVWPPHPLYVGLPHLSDPLCRFRKRVVLTIDQKRIKRIKKPPLPTQRQFMTVMDKAHALSHPLCVDLDGTLIKGHSLWQIKSKAYFSPFTWLPPRWPLIKHKIVEKALFSGQDFTYSCVLVERLSQWKKQGTPLFLITGSPEKIARTVAHHLCFFDGVWASSRSLNLVGEKKANFLLNHFGPFKFSYVGDHRKDWHVWKWAHHIFIVSSAPPSLIEYVKRKKKPFQGLTVI